MDLCLGIENASLENIGEELALKTLDTYLFNRSLVLVIAISCVLVTDTVFAAGHMTGAKIKSNTIKNFKTTHHSKKNIANQKKLYIDFSKKNQDTGSLSEMSEKIAEAERDLKKIGRPSQDKFVVGSKLKQTSNVDSQEMNALKPSKLLIEAPGSSVSTEVKSVSKVFGVNLTLAKSQEVVLPESGEYSNAATYIFNPSYKIIENYPISLKLIGVYDSIEASKSELKAGSIAVSKSAMDISEYFKISPGLVYGFPVNAKQRDIDSFLGSVQARVSLSTKENLLGDLALNTVFGVTKSFYEYSTQLNIDSKADNTYNGDYSFLEVIEAQYPLVGDLSFSFALANKQAWNYAGESKNAYDMTETLNWEIAKFFTVFGGLENEEAAKASGEDLKYRFYNSETSTYVLGMSIAI